MKIGDIVTMKQALTPERYGLGLIQKIVRARQKSYRLVYHILWPDNTISCQYDNEIVLVGRVE
jgi:mRNA-degrading endonuclease RelE of RelBE toxin-antitoxin system